MIGDNPTPLHLLAGFAIVLLIGLVGRRVARALSTVRARAWSPALSRGLARWAKPRSYSGEQFFSADGAGASWVARRQHALARLSARLRDQAPRSRAWADTIREGLSDLRFT